MRLCLFFCLLPTLLYTQNPPDQFIYLKGGAFLMGDAPGDQLAADETPHRVHLSPFYISPFEVTFEAFDAFCKATGRDTLPANGWGRGQLPVLNADWYSAIEYCNWRSIQAGLTPCYTLDKTQSDTSNHNEFDKKRWMVRCNWKANGYRLPTEAEWEYAALAGQNPANARFANGEKRIEPAKINFDARDFLARTFSEVGYYRERTIAVDSLPPNAFGLYHMSGNVWEWCWDWYDARYYTRSTDQLDPHGPASGKHRCVRGGAWDSNPENCRRANRGRNNPYVRLGSRGFRMVRRA
ncbi:MAG: SUMF1/EgtB/PvdO family nonheme iron enzyme [Chitinophagales bacterium]|nr:SUMF1/EgtB/PvdO family nonheme iron enzyme [Chitinophagales bacterium]